MGASLSARRATLSKSNGGDPVDVLRPGLFSAVVSHPVAITGAHAFAASDKNLGDSGNASGNVKGRPSRSGTGAAALARCLAGAAGGTGNDGAAQKMEKTKREPLNPGYQARHI